MNYGFRTALRRLVRGQLALDDFWLLLPPLALLIILNLLLVRPHDFWWHLRTGQIIVESGAFPTTDLFSFTRTGMPYTNQGWLMQAGYYVQYRAGGLPLIIFVNTLIVAVGYILIELACLRVSRGQVRPAVAATLTAAAVSIFNWNIRPQTASFLLFAAVVFTLETHRAKGGRIIWALPPLFALWVNLHAGFAFGLGLLGLYIVVRVVEELAGKRKLGAETRSLLAAGVVSLAALSLNPSGPLGITHYILNLFQNKGVQDLAIEWLPLSARTSDGMLFIGVVTLLLAVAYARRLVLPPYLAAAMLVFGLLTLYSRRVEPWFGMISAPALAILLSPAPRPARPARPFLALNYLVLALVVLLALGSLPWFRLHLPLPPERRSYTYAAETPVEAVKVVCQLGETARVFNDIAYGSYMTWACPSVPVFMDTRFELYPVQLFRDYLSVAAGRYDWETILAQYGVNLVFANKVEEPTLIAAIRASAHWHNMYEDADSVIFRR